MLLMGVGFSPFVRKVLVVAAEKGVALEHRQLGPTSDDPQFLAASPFRKIPGFIDGDFSLADSTAIVTYLEAKFPRPAMLPSEAKLRATAIWYEEMADTVMFPAGQKVFFNRVVLPKFMKRDGDLAAADEAQATLLPPVYAYLENAAPASGFLAGDALSIGDIAVTSILVNMHLCGAGVDAARYPKLAAYYQRISSRPSFAACITADRAALGV